MYNQVLISCDLCKVLLSGLTNFSDVKIKQKLLGEKRKVTTTKYELLTEVTIRLGSLEKV